MNKLNTVVAMAALATVSMSASAWWNGAMPPVAMTEAQQQQFAEQQTKACEQMVDAQKKQVEQFAEQQKAFAEQQAKAYERMMDVQKTHAEQYAVSQDQFPMPLGLEPMAFERPSPMSLEERDARREEVRKLREERQRTFAAQRPVRFDAAGRDARIEQMRSQMEERRKQFASRLPFDHAVMPFDVRHDEITRQMEERRAEMMKRVEEQHAATRREFDQRHPVYGPRGI